ncbi:MAG: acyltransferase [Ignavibacteria bacterium GWF2_33_9]|nr:MAG: acyltransferase [Ignavibacteria bacterium GWF2_33_9]
MLFNSLDFAIFLPIFFVLYWFVFSRNLRLQNLLIVISSYIFYGWWDWRFLSLIVISTLIDFFVGLSLKNENSTKKRKFFLSLSIIGNLGMLGFFKYFNFFLDNFQSAFTLFGTQLNVNTLHIILPVGISFYTFQTLSYTIDVYRRKMPPSEDIISFSAYVSFFPQLVAGPIERATHFLPQFLKERKFNYSKAVDGMRQILWGFFKKLVIADSAAIYANMIFNNSADYSGSTLLLGVFFFAVQIYGDFSGYSDIAIGLGKLFGFDLMRNFANPYFSRDIAEFWRRWHISLSSWFRDYLYIPIGGNRGPIWKKIRNIFAIFVISGFWHGANWTFIVWGALNALFFLPLMLFKQNRKNLDVIAAGKMFPSFREAMSIIVTFALTLFAWIFFRSASIGTAFAYISGIFSTSFFSLPTLINSEMLITLFLTAIFIAIEWIGRESKYAIEHVGLSWYRPVRWAFYYSIILIIILSLGKEQAFIYFQF